MLTGVTALAKGPRSHLGAEIERVAARRTPGEGRGKVTHRNTWLRLSWQVPLYSSLPPLFPRIAHPASSCIYAPGPGTSRYWPSGL